MRYRFEDTKKFWWLGRTLFHGRFERLMKGFKNEGTVLQGCPKGYYECQNNDINFAVPSNLTGPQNGLPNLKDNGPGIFKETIRICAEKHSRGSCVLTFDGKKLAPGLSDDGGDINLIGHESGPSIEEKRSVLQKEMDMLDKLGKCFETDATDVTEVLEINELTDKLMELLHILPTKTREIQTEKKRKERVLDTFKEREINEKGRNFSYIIDSLRCDIQRTDVCYQSALHVIGKLCHIISALNGSLAFFSIQRVVDLQSLLLVPW